MTQARYVIASRYSQTMRKLQDLVTVICFAVAALIAFHLPDFLPNGKMNSIFQYLLISGSFFYFIWAYKLPTLAYFRLPEITITSMTALGVVTIYAYTGIEGDEVITLPLWPTISGVIYLFSIGIGEEFVSRGFTFGVLKKYGTAFALTFSSIFFGLMHLNLYLGHDWDPVHAYWHCLGAASFGFVAACLMIATRSIVTPIVMHALYDWNVVFSKPAEPSIGNDAAHFDPLLQTVKDSFSFVAMDLFLGFFLLSLIFLRRYKQVPRFAQPLFLKLKLVRVD